jgi:hypothetical protein
MDKEEGEYNMKTIEVLNILKCYATKYKEEGIIKSVKGNSHMNELSDDIKMTSEEAEAVIVDFINYVGVQSCIDYGLYTRDI